MSFKVYSITHLDNLIYIGSTKKSLNYRFSAHKICERTAIGRFIKEQGEENFKIKQFFYISFKYSTPPFGIYSFIRISIFI